MLMSSEEGRPDSYIRNPADLDAAARALDRALAHCTSPQKRFILIANFHAHVQGLPAAWLQGYILFLTPQFLDLVRLPYLRAVSPAHWRSGLEFLLFAREQPWGARFPLLEAACEEAVVQTALAYGFVASLRELHALLELRGYASTSISEPEWARVFGSSATAYESFQSWLSILQRHGDSAAPIAENAYGRWTAFRQRPQSVSLVMMEHDDADTVDSGRVLLMDILPAQGSDSEVHIGNMLGAQGGDTMLQLRRAQLLAERLVSRVLDVRVPKGGYLFSIHEASASIVGESLGLATAMGIACSLTQRVNGRERWQLPTTVACVGQVDEQGALADTGWGITEKKLTAAFFSPLEAIVIPAAHREAAVHALQRLQRRYPNRALDIVGIDGMDDMLRGNSGLLVSRRSRGDRTREYIQQRSVTLLLGLVAMLLFGGAYFAWRAYIAYPNLEISLGMDIGANAIVYNPRDSLEWCFRDHQEVKLSRIPFGDLEVGDGFTRNFWIWNCSPLDLNIEMELAGPDAADWYLNWRDGTQRVEATKSMQFSVVFNPRNAGTAKQAWLLLRDKASRAVLFQLELIGAAGPPLNAGYSLQFDGEDDMLFFGERSTAFDLTEATFECWMRPYDSAHAMILHNGLIRMGEASTEDLWLGYVSADRVYFRVGSEMATITLPAALRLRAHRWTHLALAYSIPRKRITLMVNGEVVDDRHPDFIFEGPGSPYVTIGAMNNSRDKIAFFKGELDEIRLWARYRDAGEIRRNMHRTVAGLAPDLNGYWDMDATVEHTVFNANLRAHAGALRHLPSPVRSTAPIDYRRPCCRVVQGPLGRPAIELASGRYLAAARTPLPRHGDASFSFWYHQPTRDAIFFNYINVDEGWISIEDTMLFTSVDKVYVEKVPPPGWYHAVCTVTASGELTLYRDGEKFATNRSTTAAMQDWLNRFEGIQLGFRFSKQNQLGSKYYNWYHPTLNHPRAFADLHIHTRVLRPEEIRAMASGAPPPTDGLVASWTLDRAPDNNLNWIDAIGGGLMHVKQVRFWE